MTGQPRWSGVARALPWAALCVAIIVLALWGGNDGPLTAPKAIALGAVEGVTEYLPISSTGHLLVAERLLGLADGPGASAADTYAIAIQLGAILAVVALYGRRIGQLAAGLAGRDPNGRRLLSRLAVAFTPAAVVGALLNGPIKDALFGVWPIVAAWAVGGVFLLLWRPDLGGGPIERISLRGAAIVGLAQTAALWPGVSRSLVTIAATLIVGCDIVAAVEFSFLLGLATLSAATTFDLAGNGPQLLDTYGWRTPLLGALVAFATATAAVRWLVAYVRTKPLATFGWYRLAAALAATALAAAGAL